MDKPDITPEQKKTEIDLWIIAFITLGVFFCYALKGNQLRDFVTNREISVILRLLVNAGVQFGIAGLGVTIVCILRKEKFTLYGLRKANTMKAVAGTIVSFIPYICYIVISGQLHGYHPFSILVTEDVIAGGFPISLLGMALIAVVWGFFEGFNYAVICEKINKRYPPKNKWLDYGAITCAIFCLLFHPFRISFWGLIEIVTTFIAIYGMLLVKKQMGNAWGCVFAFCFIWNAL